MPQIRELFGQRFGRLVANEIVGRSADRKVLWRCQCDCGQAVIVRSSKLTTGHTESCGCLVGDQLRERKLVHGHKRRAKVGGQSRTYTTWSCMKRRCQSVENSNYRFYGGRGIKVCERWQTFENFLADMGERPAGKTLDRIEVNGNYEPGNCKWSTHSEQVRNRRLVRSARPSVDSNPT
jgi:hypothetical protein